MPHPGRACWRYGSWWLIPIIGTKIRISIGLSDIHRIPQEVGLLADQQVQEHLTSGKPLPHVGDKAIVEPYIPCVITHGIYPFLPGDEHGPLIVETLADDDEGGLPEDFLRPHDRIERPESGIVQEDDIRRNTPRYQRTFHGRRLIVIDIPVVSADDDPVYPARIIQIGTGIDPGVEKPVRPAVAARRRRPQHNGRMPVRDVLDAVVQAEPRIGADPDVAEKDDAHQNEAADRQPPYGFFGFHSKEPATKSIPPRSTEALSAGHFKILIIRNDSFFWEEYVNFGENLTTVYEKVILLYCRMPVLRSSPCAGARDLHGPAGPFLLIFYYFF